DPGAAAHGAAEALAMNGIGYRLLVCRIGTFLVAAPFPDVTVHVVEAPGVGRELADRGRLGAIDAEVLRALAVEVGLAGGDRVAEGEGGGGAGAAGVLPFGLGGKAEDAIGQLRQLAAELLAIVPADVLNGTIIAGEAAGVEAHDRLPLGLRQG